MSNVTRIIGAIDGTGPFWDRQYASEFKESHVKKVHKNAFFHERVEYVRGPSLDGLETFSKGEHMAHELAAIHACRANPKIYLTGYSRGAAAVIHTANLLSKKGIDVRALFLFDAVDRTVGGPSTEKIPANVDECFHAIRDPGTNSRTFFSNTGKDLKGGGVGMCTMQGNSLVSKDTRYIERVFFGTHGALGGLPQQEENADDLVNETDKMGLGDLARVPIQMAPSAYFFNRAMRTLTQTSVTSSQNKQTSEAVWKWMESNVLAAR